jgi:hypothetical protein
MKRKQMLAALKEFLSKEGDPQRDVWNILTALRGPDDMGGRLKNATTGVIRYALLGFRGSRNHENFLIAHGCLYGPDCEEYAKFRRETSTSHFEQHARAAFMALDLEWDEVNAQETSHDQPAST